MVEKIIINPNKVRGYGNIVSSKGTSDFITYASSITEGTDTVYGSTKNVFILASTITSADAGTSGNHNDIWTLSNFSLTRGDTYSVLAETSTSAGACTLDSSNKIGPSQTVEFDVNVVDGGNTAGFIYIRNDNSSSSLGYMTRSDLGMNANEWVHVKLVFNNSTSVTVYCSKLGEPITLTLSSTSTNYRLRFSGSSGITTIQFKNFVIY